MNDRPHFQQFPVDLPGALDRHVFDELELLRHHVLRQSSAQKLPQRFGGYFLTGLEHHVRVHHLAPLGVRHSDHTGFRHGGMLRERGFHLQRRNVAAAANDHILLPAHEPEVPVFVVPAEIARLDPAVVHHLSGEGGVIPVALHHHRTTHPDFPDLGRHQIIAPLVHDTHLGAIHRESHRTRLLATERGIHRVRSDFRGATLLGNWFPGDPFEPLLQLRRHAIAAGHTQPQRPKIALRNLGMRQHLSQGRRQQG